jgi:YafQ family addiction module toxin component
MYELEIKPEADKIFKKLVSRDKEQLLKIDSKIRELLNNPEHAQKFLNGALKGFNRVHIGHFVLIYKINDEKKIVEIYYYAHHDKVYKWRE